MELITLERKRGYFIAGLYDTYRGYFTDIRFEGYSKREVIRKLRHEYGVIVGRRF